MIPITVYLGKIKSQKINFTFTALQLENAKFTKIPLSQLIQQKKTSYGIV